MSTLDTDTTIREKLSGYHIITGGEHAHKGVLLTPAAPEDYNMPLDKIADTLEKTEDEMMNDLKNLQNLQKIMFNAIKRNLFKSIIQAARNGLHFIRNYVCASDIVAVKYFLLQNTQVTDVFIVREKNE